MSLVSTRYYSNTSALSEWYYEQFSIFQLRLSLEPNNLRCLYADSEGRFLCKWKFKWTFLYYNSFLFFPVACVILVFISFLYLQFRCDENEMVDWLNDEKVFKRGDWIKHTKLGSLKQCARYARWLKNMSTSCRNVLFAIVLVQFVLAQSTHKFSNMLFSITEKSYSLARGATCTVHRLICICIFSFLYICESKCKGVHILTWFDPAHTMRLL